MSKETFCLVQSFSVDAHARAMADHQPAPAETADRITDIVA